MIKVPRKSRSFFVFVAALGIALVLPLSVWAISIDSVYRYAWGENIGWLDFGSSEGAVDVPASTGDLTGYVWGENVGWLSLNCSNTSSCGAVDYKVTKSASSLAGYAWGENVGWVSFNCSNTSSCGSVSYGVAYDNATSAFSGYAWGENIGWISFNCSNTSSCGTADYAVKLALVPTPTPGVVPIAFLSPPPTASPSPSATPATSPAVSATPSVSPTPVSSPTPVASPTTTVVPATPIVSPPISTPTSSPYVPPVQPTNPIVQAIQQVGNLLDRLSSGILGPVAPVLKDLCGRDGVQVAACGSTTVGVVASIFGLLAGLAQQELVAASYSMLQIFGLKRKAKVWGTIYDSATKQPIPMAKVELIDASNRTLETRFADRNGRYGFLTSPDSLHSEEMRVRVVASKPGYTFPASRMPVEVDFVVYDRLYYGDLLTINKESALNFNIPLNPVSEKRHSLSGWGVGLIGTLGDRVLALGFYVGLVAVPLSYAMDPSKKNLIILLAFFAANLFRLFVVYRPYGITRDAATGKALPFALITLNDAAGKRVSFSVSDEYGRFILSGEKGQTYDVVAYTPANVVPQRMARVRLGLSGRGWVTSKIRI